MNNKLLIQRLSIEDYNKIKIKGNLFEFHLTNALFHPQKLTLRGIKRHILNRVGKNKNYIAIFHFSEKDKEIFLDKLQDIRSEIEGNCKWYMMILSEDRFSTEKRVNNLVPKGKVTTSEIDDTLSQLSK